MPLFRRRPPEPEPPAFTVGVDGHRVVIGGPVSGCELLADIDGYVAPGAHRGGDVADGRDPVALLNAKLDYAEMVDSMIAVLTLALEELEQRAVVSAAEIPARLTAEALARGLTTYDYIQAAYTRAQQRCEWARSVDALLRGHGIGVLWPAQVSHERPA